MCEQILLILNILYLDNSLLNLKCGLQNAGSPAKKISQVIDFSVMQLRISGVFQNCTEISQHIVINDRNKATLRPNKSGHTVIRFYSKRSKFGISILVDPHGTLDEWMFLLIKYPI